MVKKNNHRMKTFDALTNVMIIQAWKEAFSFGNKLMAKQPSD